MVTKKATYENLTMMTKKNHPDITPVNLVIILINSVNTEKYGFLKFGLGTYGRRYASGKYGHGNYRGRYGFRKFCRKYRGYGHKKA